MARDNQGKTYQTNTESATLPSPPQRIVKRKIGRSTFIISSRFNDAKEKNLATTIARLVMNDKYNEDGKHNA